MTIIIQDMLYEGIIKPNIGLYSSPRAISLKKDGTFHICIDYRALSDVPTRDCFPIPTIYELFDELGSPTIFSKIDLQSGYPQIKVTLENTHKTTFETFEGHYEFLVMLFGLNNAPSSFQAVMNELIRPYI